MPKSGTGRVYQRGNVWWVQYGFRGQTHRESSKSTKKGDAVALLRKRLAEMGSGQLVGQQAESVTFEDLAEMIQADYRVNARKSDIRCVLANLRRSFGLSRALDITTDRITGYIASRQEDGAANATIQNELAALKRMFNLAVRAKRLGVRPYIPSVKVNNARKGFLEGEDFDRVVSNLPLEVQPIARFAALTGWRKAEILSRTWRHVDFSRGVIRLEPGETKNGEGREFPFRALPELAELLEAQREYTRKIERERGEIVPHLFHRNGQRVACFRSAWATACERAGVPGALFHDLRRTAVRNLEKAGVPRSVAMKLTGHLTEAVYRRYAIADHAALSEGVEKLARLHGAAPEPSKILPLAR